MVSGGLKSSPFDKIKEKMNFKVCKERKHPIKMFYSCRTKENKELPLDSFIESFDNLNSSHSVFIRLLA